MDGRLVMEKQQPRIWQRFARYFLAGVFAVLPLVITVLAVTWVISFLRETIPISKRDYHIVLVPQSPVPIGGGLLFVPVESVEHVEMSVDAFMSVYVSMGVTVPKMMRGADDLLNQQ